MSGLSNDRFTLEVTERVDGDVDEYIPAKGVIIHDRRSDGRCQQAVAQLEKHCHVD